MRASDLIGKTAYDERAAASAIVELLARRGRAALWLWRR